MENKEIVLVCGGRDFCNGKMMYRVLDEIGPRTIIHGAARGADSLAGQYARNREIPCREFPARWRQNGRFNRAAGYQRNQRMLDEGNPTLIVAFPGGPGTQDMIRTSRDRGFRVLTITEEGKIQ